MPFELYVALRYLSARSSSRFLNLITIIAIGGICVGVMALIVVIGVMSGLQTEVRDRILGTNPHVMVLTFGDELRFEDWEGSLEIARTDEEVVLGVPFVYTESLVFKRTGYQQGLALRGITDETTALLEDQLTVGSWEFESANSGLPGVVLGYRLANHTGRLHPEVREIRGRRTFQERHVRVRQPDGLHLHGRGPGTGRPRRRRDGVGPLPRRPLAR
jgi:lipoprotein-releasing system permease protein